MHGKLYSLELHGDSERVEDTTMTDNIHERFKKFMTSIV